jgi:PIN domain nuclease of toxin-antitoxin system
MQIKIQLGKLQLSDSLPAILKTQQVENNLELLTIALEHVWALDSLPYHHKRLIIAQAQAEGMRLVSADGIFGMYAVELLVV